MADPGTALGIASLTWDVAKDLYQYYRIWYDCEDDIKELRTYLLWLDQTFGAVTKTLSQPGLSGEDLSRVSDAVVRCRGAATELKHILSKINLEMGNPQKSLQKVKAHIRLHAVRLMYPFKSKTIERLLANTRKCCDSLHVVLTLLGLDAVATTLHTLRTLDWKVTNGQATFEHEIKQLQLGQNADIARLTSEAAIYKAGVDDTKTAVLALQEQLFQHNVGIVHMLQNAEENKKAQNIIASLDAAVLNHRREQIPDAQGQTFEWLLADTVPQPHGRHGNKEQVSDQKETIFRKIVGSEPHLQGILTHKSQPSGAEGDTFEWVLVDERPQFLETPWQSTMPRRECRLAHWLEHDCGVFWICGKAGSGKSTFMKFLSAHEKLEELLTRWSRGKETVILEHYFWISGTSLQKSYEGMLQSLLHQLLQADPRLVPIACAQRWRSRFATRPWNIATLLKALETAIAHSEHRVCILIDGLDEYDPESEHQSLVRSISTLASGPNVKLVVSSRQWPVFEKSLGATENKVMLQDINRGDIVDYIRDKFADSSIGQIPNDFDWAFFYFHPYRSWKLHYRKENEEVYRLVDDMVYYAEGVFLWVHLITETLCERLRAGAPVSQLRAYVKTFPRKLEDYFTVLIHNRIHDTWASETAMILAVMLNEDLWERSSLLLYFIWLTKQRGTNSFLDEQWYLGISFGWCMDQDLDVVVQGVNELLAACCKDLVTPAVRSGQSISGIEFTHRTVRDFLNTDTMRDLLDSKVPDHFRDEYMTSRLYLMAAKSNVLPYTTLRQSLHPDFIGTTQSRLDRMPIAMLDDHAQTFVDFGAYLGTTKDNSCQPDGKFLLSGMLPTMLSRQRAQWMPWILNSTSSWELLGKPLLGQLEDDEPGSSPPALLAAIGFDLDGKWAGRPVELAHIKLVLEHGSSPNDDQWPFRTYYLNEQYYLSVWHRFIVQLYNKHGGCWSHDQAWAIARLLLEHGAEANVSLDVTWDPYGLFESANGNSNGSWFMWVPDVLDKCLPGFRAQHSRFFVPTRPAMPHLRHWRRVIHPCYVWPVEPKAEFHRSELHHSMLRAPGTRRLRSQSCCQ